MIENLNENIMIFEKLNSGTVCSVGGNRLRNTEIMLDLTNSKYNKIEDVNFFEFGSAHYNLSSITPRSGNESHFMGIATKLKYKCFDSYIKETDFNIMRGIIKVYNKIGSENTIMVYENKKWKEAYFKYGLIHKDKGLLNSLFIPGKKEYNKFFGRYLNLDLVKLKRQIKKFAINGYKEIEECIESSNNPVIFSHNVLNAPNLSNEFEFWKIKKGFHIHSVNMYELFKKIKFSGDEYFKTNEISLGNEKLFFDKFREEYDINSRIRITKSENGIASLYWNTE